MAGTKKGKAKKGIEIDPWNVKILRGPKDVQPQLIAVIDKKTQKRLPSLLVFPTQTVRKDEIGLVRDSEPDVRSNK